MKGDRNVVEGLNEALRSEILAVLQYFLHSEMADNWGFGKLSEFFKKRSIDEMRHAEMLIERILFLEGIPDMRLSAKVSVASEVPQMVEIDIQLELDTSEMYNRLAEEAANKRDRNTEALYKKILHEEEEHLDDYESQRDQINMMTLPNYLTEQLPEDDDRDDED